MAAFPLLVNRLPKPGPWMLTLKRILSIALIGTALWLLSVLWFQIGGPATIMIALLMVAIVFTVWQYRHLSERRGSLRGGHRSVDGDFDGRGRQLYLCWTRSVRRD